MIDLTDDKNIEEKTALQLLYIILFRIAHDFI